jgi:hypothetical protein
MKSLLSVADCQSLISILDALEVLEASRWVPEEFKGYTFFSADDRWLYVKSGNPNLCDDCAGYDGDVFYGDEVRREFPDLVIVDQNTIYVRVHPHCECVLIRLEFED